MIFNRKITIFIFLVVILSMVSCVLYANGASDTKKVMNILLVTIDTLRADHLGCYGYTAIKTPNIDKLAKKGVLFTNAYSPVPLTLPSHVSIMSGQYPIQHGVHDNGIFVLADSADTWAEIVKKNGYSTSAIVASYVLNSHFGLRQGFDHYDDHFNHDETKLPGSGEAFRDGAVVTALAKQWLGKKHEGPFFLWVHYFDPHTPYDPPDPFDRIYEGRPYDGEIAYTDQCLGSLFEEMEKLNILENTCIILVADHGEGLWEHNEQTHGLFIYDTTLRVPLIISYPNRFPKGNKINSLVGTVDILPTILEFLSIKSKEINCQGKSLIPLLTGKQKDRKHNLYCDSQYPKFNFHWAPLDGIITFDGWKFIQAPKPELYNLKNDPQEKTNLFSTNSKKAKSLQKKFLSLKQDLSPQKSHPQGDAKKIALSPETKEKLRSLGYVWSSEISSKESQTKTDLSLPDPKDKVPLLAQIDQARELEAKGSLDEALRNYREVLSKDPDNLMAHYYLGLAYKNTNEPKKALTQIQKVVEIEPHYFDCLNILGLLYDQLAMPKKAIEAYQRALEIDPHFVFVHNNLGIVYLKMNSLDLAVKEFQKVLSVSHNPRFISTALGHLGGVCLRQGNLEEALEKFKKSIKYNPANRDAHLSLADVYYHLKDIDQSIQTWKKIIELWPDDFMAYYKLAQLCLPNNESDQAVCYLRKCLQIRSDYIDARMLLKKIPLKGTIN